MVIILTDLVLLDGPLQLPELPEARLAIQLSYTTFSNVHNIYDNEERGAG